MQECLRFRQFLLSAIDFASKRPKSRKKSIMETSRFSCSRQLYRWTIYRVICSTAIKFMNKLVANRPVIAEWMLVDLQTVDVALVEAH